MPPYSLKGKGAYVAVLCKQIAFGCTCELWLEASKLSSVDLVIVIWKGGKAEKHFVAIPSDMRAEALSLSLSTYYVQQ